MGGLFDIIIDVSDLVSVEKNISEACQSALKEAAETLSKMAYAHILELAQNGLHSSREKYINALSIHEEGGVWMIVLDKPAHWIEDGKKQGEMIMDLLKSKKTKTGKDGSRYLSIPFDHGVGKGPATLSPHAVDLQSAIKASLKKQGTSWAAIETDEHGKAKIGKVRSFDVQTPNKTHEGPGMGHGPIGAPRQGKTGIPFLQNVQVHQKEMTNKDGKKSVVKSILTFRTVSSKMLGSGRWVHPGTEAKFFLTKTYDWAMETLEREIIPQILRKIEESI